MLKKEFFILGLGITFSIGVVSFLYKEFFSIGTDGVIYTLLAKSIAEGNGISLYGQPHTVFSPLLPILIAPFYLIFHNLEQSAFLENLVVGLATIPLFYLLLKTLYSRKAGLIGVTFITLNGHFIFSYLSPSPQVIVTLLGIILFLLLYRSSYLESRPARSEASALAGAGVVTGLMYLARPEYFLLPIPIVVYLALIYFRRLKSKTTAVIIGLFLAGFLVASFPYLYFLQKNLGYWTFTGRSSATSLYFSNELTIGTGEVQGDNFIVPATKEGRSESLAASLIKNPGPAAKKLFKGLRDSERNTTRVFGFIGISLFAFGIRDFLFRKRFRELGISLIVVSPLLAVALGQGGSTNYLAQFFFVILLYEAVGLCAIIDDLHNQFRFSARTVYGLTLAAVAISALYAFIPVPQNYLFTPRENIIREYKEMGLWIKRNLPEARGQVLLSRKPETAFYAEARFELIPKDLDTSGLIDFMKTHRIPYLVADERHFIKEYPQLLDLIRPGKTPKELKLIHSLDYLGNEIALYKLI